MALKTQYTFEEMVISLQKGDESVLKGPFSEHFEYCVKSLTGKFSNCTRDDAQDVYMDAFWKFRAALITGKLTDTNIRAYLLTTAKNEWLQRLRKEKRHPKTSLDPVELERYLGQREREGGETFNLMVQQEEASSLTKENINKVESKLKAWAALGESCKKLLKGFLIDNIKLKDLQLQLGYGSYDSIKSMRRKCFNQLKTQSLKIYEELT